MVAINPMTKQTEIIVDDVVKFRKFYEENKNDIWVGWNVRGYDTYIIKAILLGFNPKEVNDWIIVKNRKGYEFSSLFNTIPLITYDAMPNIPVSLKVMEGFLGKNIHETSVPFDIDRPLTKSEIDETIGYCKDDVLNLIEVFIKRKTEFDSHFSLVKEFNLPLSSLGKTQAQLAATILDAKKQRLNDEWEIRLPDNLRLGKYKHIGEWFLNPANHDYDLKLTTKIGGLDSVIAWGGLHGGLNKFQYTCKPDEVILDADIGQMYPNIMLEYDLQSRGISDKNKLKNILSTSMRLKREGKKKEREPYKRICNIVYGACGDKYNPMYDALHRNLVCVYGQVLIIDLIDKIEDIVTCLNHNTDGIFFIVKKKDLDELKRRVREWEERSRLVMEYSEFNKFISKDVNNYLAITTDGKIHAKGAYVKDLNDLDYDLPIVNEALRNYMIFGTPVEVTVNSCTDFRKFQKVVKLSSKYKWVEHELGYVPSYTPRGKLIEGYSRTIRYDNKAYRVFASKDVNDGKLLKCDGERNPAKFGNTPDHCFIENGDIRQMAIPNKLDRQYYIDLAYKRLGDFGVA